MSVHLITGGAGFVAVNLARRLLVMEERVVAVDDLSRGRLEYLKPFKTIRSLRSSNSIARSPKPLPMAYGQFTPAKPLLTFGTWPRTQTFLRAWPIRGSTCGKPS